MENVLPLNSGKTKKGSLVPRGEYFHRARILDLEISMSKQFLIKSIICNYLLIHGG